MLTLQDRLQERVAVLPKIELHRHLEGSLRLSTLAEIAREYMNIEDSTTLRPLVQMMTDEARDSSSFLSKFVMLRQFYRSEAIVARLVEEVIEDAANDHITYLELRFTPRALCSMINCPMPHMVGLVCEVGNAAAIQHNLKVRYIIGMNRHESVELGDDTLNAALAHCDKGVVGLDLAGDEANYSALPFRAIFQRAHANGLYTTVHAGEWAGVDSIREAVLELEADRIGHGLNLIHDEATLQLVIERGIALELCPTSNVLSGIVSSLEQHPIDTLTRCGVATTLNTDDPSVCDVTLSNEIEALAQTFSLSLNDIQGYMLRAAQHSFLPPHERQALTATLLTHYHESSA